MAKSYSVDKRWGDTLAKPFTPVSLFFLKNYSKLNALPNARGLTPTEAMLIVHLMSYKWDDRDPYPTVPMLAKLMGIAPRTVRNHLKTLEDHRLITRKRSPYGGSNRYDMSGLIRALEELQAKEEETSSSATSSSPEAA